MNFKFSTILASAFIFCLSIAPVYADVVLYVSPSGNDTWSGALAEPNSDHSDGPFATITRAQEQVRAIHGKGTLTEPVTVYLRDGAYRLSQPLAFHAEDGGGKSAPVTYAAYAGEQPVISGGRRIADWKVEKRDGRTVWTAVLPEVKNGTWWFREIYINGVRHPRTRLPETGYYEFTGLVDLVEKPQWNNGVRQAMFKEGDLKPWKNLNDVEIVALTRWIETRSPIAELDMEKHMVTFANQSTFRLENTKNHESFARYYVENVYEAMNEPGEWYMDYQEGILYYLPQPGERPESTVIEAPAQSGLLSIEGDENNKVNNLHFRGIMFCHAAWEFPEGDAGSVQAAFEVPGAIRLIGAEDCTFSDCKIERLGMYAMEIGKGCHNVRVLGSTLCDLGAGGIKIGPGSSHTTVADNVITRCGRTYHSAIGVWVGNSGHNAIVHNHIYDLYYTGISVGWSWGYNPTESLDNVIAYNHIHQIGQKVLSDMGAVYTLGVADGSRIHHNVVHDISCHGFGGWGIYLDEGTTHMLVENNVVYRAQRGGFHIHYGKENIIRNNIFAKAEDDQVVRSRNEDHKSFDFTNNIVYYTEGPLLGGTWENDRFVMDYNLYWNPDPTAINFKGATVEEWKARGHDVHSRIADPLFVDVDADDYRLKSASPAFELGFKAIDLSGVGPRR